MLKRRLTIVNNSSQWLTNYLTIKNNSEKCGPSATAKNLNKFSYQPFW